MASPQRRVETLKKIIQASSIDFVCPICLKGFPRSDALYHHFRKQGDNTHAGLAKRTSKKQSNMEEFLTCYRQSVNTSIAVESIPLHSHCFKVDFVVENYGENIETPHRTLLRVIENSKIRFSCPQCLKGFPRSDVLYEHFRRTGDNVHDGLAMRRTDFDRFLSCYQEALRASIPSAQLPSSAKCFEYRFIVEHYGEGDENHQSI
ncbi:uncharacterized protein BO80DRAFT_441136 [Aspergillus ibericus CBS 121593]|uniref:C2H2-type domain-containing protein n=1 Tax=Aspergillus ibericus CBS 121593 TaxID=1448316 RepID=A0A395HAB2_9EURO|nr:hypothetical protein BO80DRAFT_441136 [Aspergillus ibericus CBS 121593]RAL04891.1 hypothetical protein BO80DRAFT_441136 [Aspergillus ibericus CBS 121593]